MHSRGPGALRATSIAAAAAAAIVAAAIVAAAASSRHIPLAIWQHEIARAELSAARWPEPAAVYAQPLIVPG